MSASFLVTSYGNEQAKPGFLLFEEDKAPLFIETGGKCNFILADHDKLYAPVQKKDGGCVLQIYEQKNNQIILKESCPVSYFYSHGALKGDQLILASFSDGLEALFDLKSKKETDFFIHTRDGYKEKGRSHFVGQTPDQKHFYAVDHALQTIYLFDIKEDQFIPFGRYEFEQEERIRLMPQSMSSTRFFLNTEKTNYLYTLDYEKDGFVIRHRTSMDFEPGSFSGGLALHESGNFLAVSLRGQNTLLLYSIQKDGSLILLQSLACKNMPRDLMFIGNDLYVSCSLDDVIEIYTLKNNALTKKSELSIVNPITFTKL